MIRLKNISLRRGVKVILEQANVTLNPGEKIGLTGRNGIGKSSLFALLTHKLSADAGEVEMPPRWLISEVAQEMPETTQDASSFVVEGDVVLTRAKDELEKAQMANDGEAIATAHLHIAEANGFDAHARAQAMLLGLGFTIHDLEKPVNEFSGGWRMRLQLARALMCPADLLLLDEPTNHLDLDALVWLESWLQRYQGTVLVISHDRDFLDAVTQVTLHIEHQNLSRYTGNYSSFEEQYAQRLLLQQAAYDKQQVQIAHLQSFIDRFRAKATKAKQAQSRVKALERIEKIAPVMTAADFTFEFKEPGNVPTPMFVMDDVACGYGDQVIIDHVKCTVLAGQRIGILGANGQGKSTFVKTVAQQIQPVSGKYNQGKGLNIGYFAQQELDILRHDENALQHMIRLAEVIAPQTREQDLRTFLGSFRFVDDMVKQPVGTMSGGEKSRLVLAMIVWQRPNLLLLDEPTNHLDLITREALAMALNQFEGTVMIVSHDRSMLRSVCDEFWLVGQGQVKPFDGDLTDYQRYLLEHAKQQRELLQKTSSSDDGDARQRSTGNASNAGYNSKEQRKAAAQNRQLISEQTRPLRKESEKLEKRMAEIEGIRRSLEEQLTQPGLASDLIVSTGIELKKLADELSQAEERWIELAEEMQQVEQQIYQQK